MKYLLPRIWNKSFESSCPWTPYLTDGRATRCDRRKSLGGQFLACEAFPCRSWTAQADRPCLPCVPPDPTPRLYKVELVEVDGEPTWFRILQDEDGFDRRLAVKRMPWDRINRRRRTTREVRQTPGWSILARLWSERTYSSSSRVASCFRGVLRIWEKNITDETFRPHRVPEEVSMPVTILTTEVCSSVLVGRRRRRSRS